jgi:tetratricopeptide (TPR) repeat protein
MPPTPRPTQKNPTRAHILAVLLGIAAAGCASAPVSELGWIEARSANFSLYTTLGEPDARELLQNLELFRAAILVMTKVRSLHPHVPTEIYAFRSQSDYRPFEPFADSAGFFHATLRANFVALSAGANAEQARAILYHEYTHFVLQNEGSTHYPLWFEEGFAELLSSLDVRGANVRIGVPPAIRVASLQYGAAVSYARVLGARSYEGWGPEDLEMFYAQSWLLVHHLVLGGGKGVASQLLRYVEKVEHRVPEQQAFREAFGIEVADLGPRLKKYQQKLPIFGLSREKLAPDAATAIRAVAKDEIRTRLGWLALANEKPVLARRLFESASAANPGNARAIAGIAEGQKFERRWDEAEAGYRHALELDPGDWQNHLELARYLVERASVEDEQRSERLASARDELARVIARAPEIPEGHATLGIALAMAGDLDAGIASLEHALDLLPANAEIEYSLAQVHARAGHRQRAIELLRSVAYRAHGSAASEAVKLLESLESGKPEN